MSVGQTLFGNTNWIQGALVDTLNRLQQYNQAGWEYGTGAGRAITDAAPTGMGQASQFLWGTPEGYPGVLPSIDEQLRGYGDINALAPYFTSSALGGQGRDAQNELLNRAGEASSLSSYPNYFLGTGGQTDSTRQIYERAMDMGTGQGAEIAGMAQGGMDLLGRQGQTAYTQHLQNMAGGNLAQGGMTPELQLAGRAAGQLIGSGGANPTTGGLAQYGVGLLGSGGLTETGRAGEVAALNALMGGGATGLTNFLQSNAMGLLGGSVVPRNMVGQAVDQAGALARRQAEAAYRKALARGGGPGAITAYGGQNQAAGEFENEIMEAQASAMRDAQAKQMAAQLQERQMAANYGLGAGQLEQGRLGTSGGLLTGLEQLATQRTGMGAGMLTDAEQINNARLLQSMGLLPTITNAANQQVGTYGNLGLGAAQQELGNMGLGANLMNNYNQLRLGGLGQAAQATGMENSLFGTAGNLSNAFMGTAGNMYNQGVQNELAGNQLGSQIGSNMFNTFGNLVGQRLGAGNIAQGMYTGNINPLATLSGQGLGYAGQTAGGQAGLWGGQQTGGMLPSLIQAGSGAAAAFKP